VELALTLDEREPEDAAADPQGDLLQGRPVLSPLTWAVSYRYPVHRICREFQPRDPLEPATHLLVWRDREYRVRFMLLNEVSRLLLEQLREPLDRCGRELLEDVAAAIGHADPGTVVRSGARVLAELRERGVLLGTRPG
jgi:hypothetical protein